MEQIKNSGLNYSRKLEIEERHQDEIIIWKTAGQFYEVINHSAYLFHLLVSDYKIYLKSCKELNDPIIYSLGYNKNYHQKVIAACEKIKDASVLEEEAFCIISFDKNILKDITVSYAEWCEKMTALFRERQTEKEKKNGKTNVTSILNTNNPVFTRILNIDLTRISYAEAFQLIGELQNDVKKYLGLI